MCGIRVVMRLVIRILSVSYLGGEGTLDIRIRAVVEGLLGIELHPSDFRVNS